MSLESISKTLGREVSVIPCNGGYIVDFMSFSHPPPPVGKTEEEAISLFENYLKENPIDEVPNDEEE